MIVPALCRHLHANVDGLTFDEEFATGNVFAWHLPSTPDLAVMVTVYGSLPQATLAPTSMPTVQVMVRCPENDPVSGLELAADIHQLWAGMDLTTIDPAGPDETLVITCTALQDEAIPIGQDANRRHQFTQNYQLRTHHPTTHRPAVNA